MFELKKALTGMGYVEKNQAEVIKVVGSFCWIALLRYSTLQDYTNLSGGMVDELIAVKKWYFA